METIGELVAGRWSRLRILTLLLAGALLPTGCGGGSRSSPDAAPLLPTRELDLLVVIDNSGTSVELQLNFFAAAPQFFATLSDRFGGALPDLHIAVISGNLGAGGYDILNCIDDGDDGRFRTTPTRPPCTAQNGAWIEDVATDSGDRVRNYERTLTEVFACVGELGNSGCGFQQHLQAIRHALDGRHPDHAGFLRPDSLLAVLIVADDDDCSAADSAVFTTDEETGFGPLSQYRCAQYGWLCDGEPLPDVEATYNDCTPRGDSYLIDPSDTASFLAGLRSDPRRVLTAGVFPDRAPVSISLDEDGRTYFDNSCNRPPGYPHSTNIRDRFVVDSSDGLWIDACDMDLGPGLIQLANQIADRMGAQP